MDSKNGKVWYDKGFAYKKSGNLIVAKKCFDKAKELEYTE